MRVSLEEGLYVGARAALCVALGLLLFFDSEMTGGALGSATYSAFLIILLVGTIVMLFASQREPGSILRLLRWIIVPDLIAISGLTFLLREMGNAFYPMMVVIPIAYALVETKRNAMFVSAAFAMSSALGGLLFHSVTPLEFVLVLVDAAMIPIFVALVATSVDMQRQREAETAQAVEREEAANLELLRRIAELQAISQITEIIHSSLDFERVGPVVMDILAKVVDVQSCALFVIDADKAQTLFAASVGDARHTASAPDLMGSPVLDDDGHLTCRKVLDHGGTLVLFCASDEDLERLEAEDSFALSAIATELAVALENSRLYKLTRRLAITDELTGLSNYRHLQERIDEEIERAKRFGSAVSLLMIDADDFKAFNDTFGHLSGDHMLSELAGVMRASVREIDFVARYGGEEFSILLPETDAPGAFVVAEKVREAIATRARVTTADGGEGRMTVSIGVCSFPALASDKESLLRGADDALYCAKNNGKNRVAAPATESCRTAPVVTEERNS